MEVSVAQWSKYILPNRRDAGSNLAWTQKHGCGQNGHLVVRSDLSMTGEPREGRTRSGGVYPGPPTGTFGTMTSSGYTFCQCVDFLKKIVWSLDKSTVFLRWVLDNPLQPSQLWHLSFTPHQAFSSWRPGWDLNQWPQTHEAELIPLSHRSPSSDCAGSYISPVSWHEFSHYIN